MNEGAAAVAARVPRGTFELLTQYVALLCDEAARQNLIAHSTVADIWHRHILDSLQLSALAPPGGLWADVGSGAGLPGLVIAAASERRVVLIEPRKRRAEFLVHVVRELGLDQRVTVSAQKSEAVCLPEPADVISARAVAPLERVFCLASHLGDRTTRWILPKGRAAAEEVAIARRTWQGDFELVPSLTEPTSAIVIASEVRRRGKA